MNIDLILLSQAAAQGCAAIQNCDAVRRIAGASTFLVMPPAHLPGDPAKEREGQKNGWPAQYR
ncbi:hypothetical protein CAL26_10055 [Bordetella genomosp. 9]|uniref:Uncharacterized protein n=1 Tax=Bordetella genomosp. 9 TaxID=1416803 RepID=A0A261RHH2_9BORD|nr:hypothetical protein [Bordetella genomosp. 9]OZI23763.1 hypothetical protein CAL26_10055 [Bordetella genomosp. 9]